MDRSFGPPLFDRSFASCGCPGCTRWFWDDGLVEKRSGGRAVNAGEWVLAVRVVLVDSEPEIWRLLELRSSLTLGRVHRILQVAFGWEDAHLHRFTESDPFAPLRPVDGEIPDTLQWVPADWCEEPTDLDEEDCSLDQLLTRGSSTAFYEYDFGDSWLHRIELVSRWPADEDAPPARLTDGAPTWSVGRLRRAPGI